MGAIFALSSAKNAHSIGISGTFFDPRHCLALRNNLCYLSTVFNDSCRLVMSRRDKHATWKLAPAAIAALEKLAPPKDLEGIGAALLASTADVFKEPAAAAAAVALASACQLNSLAAERDEELSWPLAEVELPKRGRTEGQTLETERALAVLGWELAKTGGEKLRPTTIVKAYLRTQGYNEGEALDNRADYVVRAFNKKA